MIPLFFRRVRQIFHVALIVLLSMFGVLVLSAPAVVEPLAAEPVNPVMLENQNPGTSAWQSPNFERYGEDIRTPRQNPADDPDYVPSPADEGSGATQTINWVDNKLISGYTGAASVNAGDPITFHISSKVPFYDLSVYRVGWYDGNGGRWMASATNLPGTNYGVPQPDPVTGRVEANWPVTYTLNTSPDWVSGIYLVWMSEHGVENGPVSYMIFVVRNDSRQADIVYQVALSTYQAYNAWGGKSLYEYNSINGRAHEVSFDRPYDHDDGVGLFFSGDYNMVRWLESQNYDVKYTTSVETQADPHMMDTGKVFLSNFHDEYWSWTMFDNIETALAQGKDLAWFDSNNVYWQIRWGSSSSGVPNRVIVCYKDANLDPVRTGSTPHLTTVLFRDPIVNRPENSLLGIMFHNAMGFGDHFPYIVTNADHWVYEGTGLQNGDQIPLLVGYEYDRVHDNGRTPANLEVLSHSPAPELFGAHSNTSIYTASSGAMVFSASTNYWAYFLDGNWIWPKDARIQRMTSNILNRMIGIDEPLPVTPGTPTATRTPVPTLTPTATHEPGTTAFYRAVNFGGQEVVIDGNHWEGNSAVNVSTNGFSSCSQNAVLNPATDANREAMLRCYRWNQNLTVSMANMPNGSYDVYLYVVDLDEWEQVFGVSFEGQVVQDNISSGTNGQWTKLGPWRVNLSDGTLNVAFTGDAWLTIPGIEVWFAGGASSTSTPTNTATNTTVPPTASPTNTATNAPLPTNTPTPTNTTTHVPPTNTPTPTNTSTTVPPTNTPTPTNTATDVVPTNTPTPTNTQGAGTSSLYRAINFGGQAVVIDGNNWEGDGAPGVTVQGYTSCNPNLVLNPATDANRTTMLRCYRWNQNLTVSMANMFNGSYDVYLYVVDEDAWAQTFGVTLEGQLVQDGISTGTNGQWKRLGPWRVTVADGTLNLGITGPGWNAFPGIEVWHAGGTVATATATATNTTVPTQSPTATNTATNVPPTNTPTPTNTTVPGTTPTPTSTNTATTIPFPTLIPSATNTPTVVAPTNTPTPTNTQGAGTSSLYRAINFGGQAVVIDGNGWEGDGAPDVTVQGYTSCKPNLVLNPATDANRTTMLRCYRWNQNLTVSMANMFNGSYDVYLYVIDEDAWAQTFGVTLEGQLVQDGISTGTNGQWKRLGPWRVTVADGTLNLGITGPGWNAFPGIEVWHAGGAPSNPTATSTTVPGATATPTATNTTVPVSTLTPTNTATTVPFPTLIPSATNTDVAPPTLVPTATATLPPVSGGLYRAINFGGQAVVIDGSSWEGDGAPGVSVNGYNACLPNLTLVPATDANRATMLRCLRWNQRLSVSMATTPNGSYDVYLYVLEDDWAQTFGVTIEGQLVQDNISSGSPGQWQRLGPWRVTVADGTLNLALTGDGWVLVSGIEVWHAAEIGQTGLQLAAPSLPTLAPPTATHTAQPEPTTAPTATETQMPPPEVPADPPPQPEATDEV